MQYEAGMLFRREKSKNVTEILIKRIKQPTRGNNSVEFIQVYRIIG